jgi:hypothetical protein
MTPNHHPGDGKFPGIIRFTTPCGRPFVAYGDSRKYAEAVKAEIERIVMGGNAHG